MKINSSLLTKYRIKAYLYFLSLVVLVNVLISLVINADLLANQKKYIDLEKSISQLREENNKLNRKLAHLSSLTMISQAAEEMGLGHDKKNIVFVSKSQFAKR